MEPLHPCNGTAPRDVVLSRGRCVVTRGRLQEFYLFDSFIVRDVKLRVPDQRAVPLRNAKMIEVEAFQKFEPTSLSYLLIVRVGTDRHPTLS